MTSDDRESITVPDGATDPESVTPTPPPPGIASGYQPGLDGIRAVAIGLVVAYHLGLDRGFVFMENGWLGVDVFFVLSGYLITSLLLREHDATGGISLANFYVRRFLRLAPLVVALVLGLFGIRLVGLNDTLGLELPVASGVSVLFYYANWWSIAHPDDFGILGPAWSLSIEEQFYFLWPVLVVFAFWVAGRATHRCISARGVLAGFTIAAALAMGFARRAIWLANSGAGNSYDHVIATWRMLYWSSFLRPDGLLIGCATALILHRVVVTDRVRRLSSWAAFVGVIVAGVLVIRANVPGWSESIPVEPAGTLSIFNLAIALIVASLVLNRRSLMARALSVRPLTWIGRRAYGIYLMQPLILAVLVHRTSLRRLPMEAATITLTLVATGLSFRYFETPFLRLKERFST